MSQLKGVFYAVDAKTGKQQWKRTFPFCSASSPALARRLVIETYIPQPCTRGPRGVPGQVIAMRESDGHTIWKKPIASESSPLVVGELVYVGSWDHRLYALGLGTGKMLWSIRVDGEVNSSAAYRGGMVFVGDNSGTLTALDARTGAIRWKARSFSRFRTAASTSTRRHRRLRSRVRVEHGRDRLRLRRRARAICSGRATSARTSTRRPPSGTGRSTSAPTTAGSTPSTRPRARPAGCARCLRRCTARRP